MGWLMDTGQVSAELISMLKRNNCAKALDIAKMREIYMATMVSVMNTR